MLVGQVELSHLSLLGNMKPHKQRNYAASYSRYSKEEQIKSESRTRENLREEAFTVGVFESL